MGQERNSSQGFTLIAALLILVLLSGVAAGLLFMVTNESRMGGNDMEANLAYYGAESGMEKLTADLSALYAQYQAPTSAQIQNLVNYPPTSAQVSGMNYTPPPTIVYPEDVNGNPVSTYNTVSAGSNQGLYAEIIPMTLSVTATRPGGASVNVTRKVEVALIPVFQFGVFCGYDCSYFAGPDFSFGGRVHTNQNLFLAAGGDLVFNDKISAYQQIVMDRLENGHMTTSGYTGTVYVPKASAGCPLNVFPPTGTNCKALPGAGTVPGDASWSGGYPSVAGSKNTNFPSISSGTLNGFLTNSLTGAKNMQLPFVQNSCTSNPPPCTDPISIIRKPLAGEAANSTLGTSRLYNKAQIRILLADTQADLHPDRAFSDADDVQFPNTTTFSTVPFSNAKVAVAGAPGGSEAVGFATAGNNGWVKPYTDSGLTTWTSWPLIGELTNNPSTPAAMTGPWIRVEWCTSPTSCTGVTREWLSLGFGQPFNTVPTTPKGGAGQNPVNPNAILILQQLQPGVAVSAANIALTSTWYPINFYDAREGEMRDNPAANPNYTSGSSTYSSCSVNGIMNAVELDVGNLALWLKGSIGSTGASVPSAQENGYVLYFSDHRGMLPSTHPSNGGQTPAGVINGESGLEDVVNSTQNFNSSTPDGVLEPATYYTYSPEDVDQNGFLDNWGEKNIGYGFGINTNTSPLNSYVRVPNPGPVKNTTLNCAMYNSGTSPYYILGANNQVGMANMVSGARHVLKLVDGGMSTTLQSYLPVKPASSGCSQSATNPTGCGGFTVASENPVYIQGDYNTSSSDPFWATANSATPTQTPHSAASIVADSVTVLSDQWNDANSLAYPTTISKRAPTLAGYYRAAISGGKNIPFPQPTWTSAAQDLGTDGGMHNFLRYLEQWSPVVHYDGSLVNMYYAEYNTGIYKDGGGGSGSGVYSPPNRNYYFDVLFLNPANLPPATPEFQDIDSLSYHQNFTPQ